MTSSAKIENIDFPFLNASLSRVQLVSEQVSFTPSTGESVPIQVRAELSNTFSISLNDPKKPTLLQIKSDNTVLLKLGPNGPTIADYKASHLAEFKIINMRGFDSASHFPHAALVPYLAMINYVAHKRTQETLMDMGFGSVVLPAIADFNTAESPPDAEK